MKNTLSNVLFFAAGAAIGSAVTWKLIKARYEQIAQEEISVMENYYADKYGCDGDDEELCETEDEDPDVRRSNPYEKPDIREYAALLAKEGYTDYSSVHTTEPEPEEEPEVEEVNDMPRPYVITPEEYGECDGYELMSLVYYTDGVVTDTRGNVLVDVDDVIGIDSLSHFGEYEDDSVFVRNDALLTDYEILLDYRRYADAINQVPYPEED